MNGWDVFTWFCAVALAAGAVLIFVLFLRDARGILQREHRPDGDPPDAPRADDGVDRGPIE